MVPIKKHLGYLVFCTKYLRNMGTKMGQLEAKRLGVESHMNRNKRNNLEVPAEVMGLLEEVIKINAQVENIPQDIGSCFNLKLRHKLGRKAFKIIEEINRVIEENFMIIWTDHPIPLGKVDSMKASTSTPSSHHNDFKSREQTFMEALKALQLDHKSHMIALCGMGGVGKTTMMEKLKKVVIEKKMFDFIVEATIGEKTDPIAIQQSVADFLSIDLTERTKAARASKLRKSFEAHSNEGKKKILVILDDVWQLIDLNDIGLCPLPNQGDGFKVLLTSRNRHVCTMMGVEVNSILNVEVIEDLEAQNFFRQIVKVSNDVDLDLNLRNIGDDIASRCHGLPIAIRTVAYALKGKSNKHVWEDTLARLKDHDVDEVLRQIFEMSYNNLKNEETRSTLLLCGLFPEDFDIPKEDLVRCGWGLKLFYKVYTIRETRDRLNTCIERLMDANLLIQCQDFRYVKMHDLVRAFVLDTCSKGEHASVVGNMSKWAAKDMGEPCKRISLTCKGMLEFPRHRKYPNLLLLKLMYGDKSLSFPADFYGEMQNLQVITYDKLEYPLLSGSLQCLTNLRTLCLHHCSLMFGCSSIGNLLNLEVLSFAHCRIQRLPLIIGNLKKLKLLDLTGCIDLIIDDGVLNNLVKLEELYMRVGISRMLNSFMSGEKAIRFTNNIYNELAEHSKNLFALELEFFDKNALPKNMPFKQLERFKISLGCYLKDDNSQNMHSSENKLMLVANKCELLDSRMYELFDKTEVLHLHVDGINDLGYGLVESFHNHESQFYNLRVLHICKCENLKYLFTVGMANGLVKLERLTISLCPVLETLVYTKNKGDEVIKFQALKFLSLHELPKLTSLCNAVNVIELCQLEELMLEALPYFTSIYPDNNSTSSSMLDDMCATQPFLKQEVVISPLKILKICKMERLKEIWPSQLSKNEEVTLSMLRMITVDKCDSLVNLFPNNPISLLHHLEELNVSECGSIEVLFNIDLRYVDKIEEFTSCLRSIKVYWLWNLREVWRIKGANNSSLVVSGFHAFKSFHIDHCPRLRNVLTHVSLDFDMRALMKVTVNGIDGLGENKGDNNMIEASQEDEISVASNEEISKVDDNIPNVLFPYYLMHTFHHLHELHLSCNEGLEGPEAVFEIESSSNGKSGTTRNNQQPLLPYLEYLSLFNMTSMRHVWKCNWNKFLISQQEPKSSFHNLTCILLMRCKRIEYLFSPLMAKLLPNLKNISISMCEAMEELVSNRDDEEEMATCISSHTNTTFFPCLNLLELYDSHCVKRIDGVGVKCGGNKHTSDTTNTSTLVDDKFQCSQMGVASWSLCLYLKTITIGGCNALSNVIPSHARGQPPKVEELKILSCKSMTEIFETDGVINNDVDSNTNGGEVISNDRGPIVTTILRSTNMTLLELPNLKVLRIEECCLLKNIFTSSTLGSLKKLEELEIKRCNAIQVIVKEEKGEHKIASKDVVFPRLKSLTLAELPNLKGFFLGKNDFQWPLLDKVQISDCPQMMVFTAGHSKAPEIKYVHTGVGKQSLECGLNFNWTKASHENVKQEQEIGPGGQIKENEENENDKGIELIDEEIEMQQDDQEQADRKEKENAKNKQHNCEVRIQQDQERII